MVCALGEVVRRGSVGIAKRHGIDGKTRSVSANASGHFPFKSGDGFRIGPDQSLSHATIQFGSMNQ